MYDFYRNPPQSKADLREWLTDWLVKPEKETTFEVHNELFSLELGFTRAGYSHEVIRSKQSGEYIWWVTENCYEVDSRSFPTLRFQTYDALLEHVINYYSREWNLSA